MNNGFILIWRKFKETSFYKNSYTVHLALHLLMEANHEDKKFIFNNEEILVKRGQCIVGRKILSQETGMPEGTVYDKLKILEKVGFCNIKSNNKFSIITICKYSDYQDKKEHKQQQKQQPANNQPTTKQQPANTNNNDNNDNNDNNTIVSRDYFYAAYKKAFDKDYIANFVKDGSIFKDLAKKIALEELKTLIDRFFASQDEFVIKAGYTTGIFKTRINSLRMDKKPNKVSDKTLKSIEAAKNWLSKDKEAVNVS